MCLNTGWLSVLLYFLPPGLGVLGPAAGRWRSGEAAACATASQRAQGHSEPPASWSAAENTVLVFSLRGQCYLPGIWYQMALPVPAPSHTVLGSYQLVLCGVKFSLCLINGLFVLKDSWGKCGNIRWYSRCVLAREVIKLIEEFNPKIHHGKYLEYRHQTRQEFCIWSFHFFL